MGTRLDLPHASSLCPSFGHPDGFASVPPSLPRDPGISYPIEYGHTVYQLTP